MQPVNSLNSNRIKNNLYNGGMIFFERGSSISVPAVSATYTADRWNLFAAAGQAHTVTPANYTFDKNLCKVQRNSGQTGTGIGYFSQTLPTEDSVKMSGKRVTFSFVAKKGADYSAASDFLDARVYTHQTNGQQDTNFYTWNQEIHFSHVVTLTTTLQRFFFTVDIPVNTVGVAVVFEKNSTGTAGADDSYYVSDCQLEIAGAATPFELRGLTTDGELMQCRRFYWKGVNGFSHFFIRYDSLSPWITINFPTRMRTIPAITCPFVATNAPVSINSVGVHFTTQDYVALDIFTAAAGYSFGIALFPTADAEL